MNLYHIRILYFVLIIFLTTKGIAQEIRLSDTAEVSILTMGPGDVLNDSFGHSAFRVKDTNQNIDLVYNYGVYDFNTPNFYLKFAQGKLLYNLDRNNFSPFYNYYANQNRWIKEQILNLNSTEKQDVFNFLQANYEPENRSYKYDFFFDNCAKLMSPKDRLFLEYRTTEDSDRIKTTGLHYRNFLNVKEVEKLFNAVRKGLGLKESTNFRKHININPNETRESFFNKEIFNEDDKVIRDIKNFFGKLQPEKESRDYLLTFIALCLDGRRTPSFLHNVVHGQKGL